MAHITKSRIPVLKSSEMNNACIPSSKGEPAKCVTNDSMTAIFANPYEKLRKLRATGASTLNPNTIQRYNKTCEIAHSSASNVKYEIIEGKSITPQNMTKKLVKSQMANVVSCQTMIRKIRSNDPTLKQNLIVIERTFIPQRRFQSYIKAISKNGKKLLIMENKKKSSTSQNKINSASNDMVTNNVMSIEPFTDKDLLRKQANTEKELERIMKELKDNFRKKKHKKAIQTNLGEIKRSMLGDYSKCIGTEQRVYVSVEVQAQLNQGTMLIYASEKIKNIFNKLQIIENDLVNCRVNSHRLLDQGDNSGTETNANEILQDDAASIQTKRGPCPTIVAYKPKLSDIIEEIPPIDISLKDKGIKSHSDGNKELDLLSNAGETDFSRTVEYSEFDNEPSNDNAIAEDTKSKSERLLNSTDSYKTRFKHKERIQNIKKLIEDLRAEKPMKTKGPSKNIQRNIISRLPIFSEEFIEQEEECLDIYVSHSMFNLSMILGRLESIMDNNPDVSKFVQKNFF